MRRVKNLAVFSSLSGVSLLGATYYFFDELRDNPTELLKASVRLGRVIKTSLKMGCIYQFNVYYNEKKEWYDHLRKTLVGSKWIIREFKQKSGVLY